MHPWWACDAEVDHTGLVALPEQGFKSHSLEGQTTSKAGIPMEYLCGLLEAFKEKCLRNIKFTLKPFWEGHKSPISHITGSELVILLIFKCHFSFLQISYFFAREKGGVDILEPALTKVSHHLVSAKYMCITEHLCISSLKVWRSGLCFLELSPIFQAPCSNP